MIKIDEILMGRETEYPLDLPTLTNLTRLLGAINYIRGRYGKVMRITSGYRPGKFNRSAKGAKLSAHITCEAVDIADPDKEFSKWCFQNMRELERAGLYMEEPAHTPTWVHLQIRPTASGRRIFNP
jgi:hypothetical protein